MKERGAIEVLARGVCVKKGRLLLCRTKGAANTYLPGGHVEFDEPAKSALSREIEEEMGLSPKVGRFLGAVEHGFIQKKRRHCEVNLVFEMTVVGLRADTMPVSEEDYIEFLWVDLGELAVSGLEPHVLRRVLPRWLRGGRREEHWSSTLAGDV